MLSEGERRVIGYLAHNGSDNHGLQRLLVEYCLKHGGEELPYTSVGLEASKATERAPDGPVVITDHTGAATTPSERKRKFKVGDFVVIDLEEGSRLGQVVEWQQNRSGDLLLYRVQLSGGKLGTWAEASLKAACPDPTDTAMIDWLEANDMECVRGAYGDKLWVARKISTGARASTARLSWREAIQDAMATRSAKE